eukprot:CAMPEP_0183358020 /NCGR_PEP_ID=MMETSP0164_2-20130417/47993_1 /TAXON_ID=221442 /ORGANISM="Coccolithus pelagicus ssp braarudi, Strain PLY182g" /LENGTH=379 /DNA_ID=CAMNT_0025531813 /DNA_START=51 /DNA_END=1190 /DNA_ORIENTATION=+
MIACLVAVAAASTLKQIDPEWEDFKRVHHKTYADSSEEQARHSLFTITKARVEELNRLNGQKAFGITWTADRYDSEKHAKGLKRPRGWKPDHSKYPVRDYKATARNPSSINWRYTEAITPIKNQGQCGSCWAFSATEAIESQMILGTGGKFSSALSPQQITSCSPNSGNYSCLGCNGGFTEGAYQYLETVAGLANAFYIPYEQSLDFSSTTKECPTVKVENIANTEYEELQGAYAAVSGYHYPVPPCTSGACTNQDLGALAAALETTPVSICVNAEQWNDYTGGVMTSAACGPMGAEYQDHCVMATGFNSTAPTPYWIVRNSWASTWGENGYIYLEMAENTCGLADDVTIPNVKLNLNAQEMAEAAVARESMYRRATMA